MNPLDFTPPHSTEAEQGVLGGLMLDNNTWDLIADLLVPEDFFKREHRLIFQVIASLAEKDHPFDIVTVSESMSQPEEVGGLAYLGDLARNTPSVANIERYAEIVRNRSHLRSLMSLGYQCSRDAAESTAVATDVQESIEQQLFALAQNRTRSDFVDVNQALGAVINKIDEHFNGNVTVTGVPSGIDDLDEMTSGFQPTDLIILAGRPSMGKTALALKFVHAALRQCSDNESVQVYSIEMPAQALLFRLISSIGHVDLTKLLKGKLEDEDWPKLTNAVHQLNGFGDRLVIDDGSSLTPPALRAKARRASRRFGKPKLILIDYLQLMSAVGEENRNNEISVISRSLKALGKEMDCPVIALSQLNRSVEGRPNKRPVNADLRESGAIEQDADVIMFVYRDEYYHPESEHKGIAEIIIGKQRQGPVGFARAAFIPQQTRFENLAPASWQGGCA